MLSDGRLFQIFATRTAKNLFSHWCCKKAKSVYIGVHGCYSFNVAERVLTDLYPQDQRSVCTQMSNHSELFLVPSFLAAMQKVVDNTLRAGFSVR